MTRSGLSAATALKSGELLLPTVFADGAASAGVSVVRPTTSRPSARARSAAEALKATTFVTVSGTLTVLPSWSVTVRGPLFAVAAMVAVGEGRGGTAAGLFPQPP